MRCCDYCGKENDDASVNCAGCGCSLVESDNKDGQSTGEVARYIFRAIICLLGFGLLFLFFRYGIWRAGPKAWLTFGALTGLFIGYGIRTATNGMTKRHPLENQYRSGFTLLTCPVPKERSVHLSFRTFQRKGHPHPALSRSTPGHFPSGLSPKTSRPTELETRPHPGL
jgi:hypothetical protein